MTTPRMNPETCPLCADIENGNIGTSRYYKDEQLCDECRDELHEESITDMQDELPR